MVQPLYRTIVYRTIVYRTVVYRTVVTNTPWHNEILLYTCGTLQTLMYDISAYMPIEKQIT